MKTRRLKHNETTGRDMNSKMVTRMQSRWAVIAVAVCLAWGVASVGHAAIVTLQNATATYFQPSAGLDVAQTIDGLASVGLLNGWAVDPQESTAQAAAWQAVSPVVGGTGGSAFTFDLQQLYGSGGYTLARFRVSVTTDVAPGLASTWTQLTPLTVTDTTISGNPLFDLATFTINGDNSISTTGGNASRDHTFTVTADSSLNNITGFRLEALRSGITSGFIGNAGNGNFILTEFTVNATDLMIPEPSTVLLLALAGAGLLARGRGGER